MLTFWVIISKNSKKKTGLANKVIFHQENFPTQIPSYMCCSYSKIGKLKYSLLHHSPYLPDLVPADFHLFSNLNKFLTAKQLSSDDEMKGADVEA